MIWKRTALLLWMEWCMDMKPITAAASLNSSKPVWECSWSTAEQKKCWRNAASTLVSLSLKIEFSTSRHFSHASHYLLKPGFLFFFSTLLGNQMYLCHTSPKVLKISRKWGGGNLCLGSHLPHLFIQNATLPPGTVFAHLQYTRQWHPTPVLLPGKSRGRRGLVGCSPWGR